MPSLPQLWQLREQAASPRHLPVHCPSCTSTTGASSSSFPSLLGLRQLISFLSCLSMGSPMQQTEGHLQKILNPHCLGHPVSVMVTVVTPQASSSLCSHGLQDIQTFSLGSNILNPAVHVLQEPLAVLIHKPWGEFPVPPSSGPGDTGAGGFGVKPVKTEFWPHPDPKHRVKQGSNLRVLVDLSPFCESAPWEHEELFYFCYFWLEIHWFPSSEWTSNRNLLPVIFPLPRHCAGHGG